MILKKTLKLYKFCSYKCLFSMIHELIYVKYLKMCLMSQIWLDDEEEGL